MGDGQWAMGKAEKDQKDQKDLKDLKDRKDGGGTPNGAPGTGALPKAEVSPGSEGLRRRISEAPGFRRAEGVGDTRMLSCVII